MAQGVNRAVLDSSVAIALVLSLPYSAQAVALVESLSTADIYVPTLWQYEVVSTLRKAVALGRFSTAQVEQALSRLLTLPNTQVAPDAALHREALKWAERLGQGVAHDAQYLAVASYLGAEFWTADRRLVERARASGADWVHPIGTEV